MVKFLKEHILPLILIFISTAAICILALVTTSLIDKNVIRQNCKESAEYFYERELFPYLLKDQFNTRQDNYADTILVNIMYHVDREQLLTSLVKAPYYQKEGENVHYSFYEALQEDKEPNVEYFRYWHGAMVLLRPLFIFTDIEGARLVLGSLLLVLTLLVGISLHRKEETALGVCYLIANLLIQSWMCMFCVEYITTFLIMNSIVLWMIYCCGKYQNNRVLLNKKSGAIMCVAGVTTCFFDFLTTETITITIPLFILLVLLYKANKLEEIKKELIFLVTRGMIWGLSYGAMFSLKWTIAAVFLGGEAFGKAVESASVRMIGTVTLGNTNLDEVATSWKRFMGALIRNQGALFPFRGEMKMGAAIAAFGGILFLSFAIIYLFHSRNISYQLMVLAALLCLVPYVRYTVLANHAYLHYFFTYRAQLIVLFVLLFFIWEFGLKNIGMKRTKNKR